MNNLHYSVALDEVDIPWVALTSGVVLFEISNYLK